MNKNLTTDRFIFLLIISITSFALYLSFSGIISFTHGPLYYFYAEGLIEHKRLVGNMFAIPSEVYTPQIGISYIHAIGIFFLGKKYWFIFYILFVSVLWNFVFQIVKKNNLFDNLINKEKILLFLLLFLQPYNINQIANFSNESVYVPLLIISFFSLTDFIKRNQNEKISFIKQDVFIILFLFFGVLFRVHNIILFASIIFYFLLNKQYKLLVYSTLYFIFALTCYIIFTKGYIPHAFGLLKNFALNMYNSNIIGQYIGDKLSEDHYLSLDKDVYLHKLVNATSVFSFFLFLKKFLSDSYLKILFINVIFIIIFYFSLKILRNKNRIFYNLSLIFVIFSAIFIYLIPIFEYSYLLPSSFLIIIFYFFYFKNLFKSNFIKVSYFLIALYSAIIASIFLIYENDKIETFQYRETFNSFKNLTKDFKTENTLLYFNEELITMPEFYSWISKNKICNKELKVSQCAKILNKKEIKYIIVKYGTHQLDNNFSLKFIDNINDYEKNYNNKILILTKR
jgi:hypothetical protein